MELDLLEQAEAISAVLAEALAETSVSGFFVRQYNPVLRLQDPSPSVNGKTALEVLKIWYPLVTGQ
jgi:hypothetical protein